MQLLELINYNSAKELFFFCAIVVHCCDATHWSTSPVGLQRCCQYGTCVPVNLCACIRTLLSYICIIIACKAALIWLECESWHYYSSIFMCIYLCVCVNYGGTGRQTEVACKFLDLRTTRCAILLLMKNELLFQLQKNIYNWIKKHILHKLY